MHKNSSQEPEYPLEHILENKIIYMHRRVGLFKALKPSRDILFVIKLKDFKKY